jgi:hypothetical protein
MSAAVGGDLQRNLRRGVGVKDANRAGEQIKNVIENVQNLREKIQDFIPVKPDEVGPMYGGAGSLTADPPKLETLGSDSGAAAPRILPSVEEIQRQNQHLNPEQPKNDGYDLPSTDYSGSLSNVNIGSSGFVEKKKIDTVANKAQTGEKFAPAFGKSQLRYPYETTQASQDYLRFNIYKYQRKTRTREATVNGRTETVNSLIVARGIGDETVDIIPRNLLGSILLPVPSQIGSSNNVQYGESKVNAFAAAGFEAGVDIARSNNPIDALRKAISNVDRGIDLAVENRDLITTALVANAVNQLGANLDVNQVLARDSGQIINPNMELLFNSPTLRQFKFQFKFTPRFEKETLEVKRIIKAFKKNMSPKGGNSGALLKTPNIFQLQYVKGNGRSQGFLHEFKLCALQNVSVNYTGDGTYATYYDGTPVSMTIDLSFQELSPVYNEDYDLRDNTDGVGF